MPYKGAKKKKKKNSMPYCSGFSITASAQEQVNSYRKFNSDMKYCPGM
jgi:hypothetical protein